MNWTGFEPEPNEQVRAASSPIDVLGALEILIFGGIDALPCDVKIANTTQINSVFMSPIDESD
jgi:hypothetical protein